MMGWFMMGWYMMGWYMMGYIIIFNRLAGISNVSLLVPPMVLPRSQEFTDTHCKLVIQSYTQSILWRNATWHLVALTIIQATSAPNCIIHQSISYIVLVRVIANRV